MGQHAQGSRPLPIRGGGSMSDIRWGSWAWHPTFPTETAAHAYANEHYPDLPREVRETAYGDYRIRIGLVRGTA